MTKFEKVISLIDTTRKYINSGFESVSNEEHERRISICKACEHFDGSRCDICGCFMIVKAKMAVAECPVGKWSAGQTAQPLQNQNLIPSSGNGCGCKNQ